MDTFFLSPLLFLLLLVSWTTAVTTSVHSPSTTETFNVAYNSESEKSWKLPHVLDGISHGDVTSLSGSQSASSTASKCDPSRHQDVWYVQNITQGALNALAGVDSSQLYIVGTGRGADLAMVAGRCLRTNSPVEGAAMSANFSGVGRIQSGVSKYTLKQKSCKKF